MTLKLMQAHVETLFRLDGSGRMVEVNQPDCPPAPRLFVGRTLEGNIHRFRRDLPEQLVSELEEILAHEPVIDDLSQPPAKYQALHDALAAHAPVEHVWQGPAWHFPEEIRQPDGIDTLTVTDAEMMQRWSSLLAREWADGVLDSQPCVVVLEGDDMASICCSSRTSPQASEAGVETMEPYRGRGYATAAVAAWAREVRALGREPLYSTSWDNHASRAVARRLGLIQYGIDLHFS